jgi:DNA-binding NarL/FixJ family response regulator
MQQAMSKTIVLVGHCGPDSSYLRLAASGAVKGATVVSADDESDLSRHIAAGADLLLVNRVLDYGFKETEGVALIARLRLSHPQVKTMLVSNYDDAQQAAVAAGALPGFGKREIGTSRVKQLIQQALGAE